MILPILKTLHIISVIAWMGVLLYIPRLFIFQLEANSKTEPDRSILINQYKLMSKRLWIRVGWLAMACTIVFGMGIMHPYFSTIWFWVKMAFVVALIGYHHIIHFTYKNLQKDTYKKSVEQLKTLNQIGVVFLIAITAIAVLKVMINNLLIIGGIAVLIVIVFIVGRALIRKSSKD